MNARLTHLILPALMAILFTNGCSTIQTTSRHEVNEGKEIKGTEQFELRIARLTEKPLNQQQKVLLEPEAVIRTYQVEQWRKSWNEVTRKRRLAVIGVHNDYNFGMDVFGDIFIGAFGAVFSPIALLMSPDDNGEALVACLSATLGILPFVSGISKGVVTETVDLDIEERLVKPVTKTEEVPSTRINNTRLDWTVLRPGVSDAETGRIRWPEPILLPWCDWVLDQPDKRIFNLTVSSEDITVSGQTKIRMEANLNDVVLRQWPNPVNRPKLGLSLSSVLLDSAGKPLNKLRAGSQAILRLHLKNGVFSPAAYALTPQITALSGPELRWGSPPVVDYVPARDSKSVDVPIQLPLDAPDGIIKLNLQCLDLFNRLTEPTVVELACAHTDLPQLQIFTTTIEPSEDGSGRLLKVTLRNSGQGPADQVRVRLEQLPPGMRCDQAEQVVEHLDARARGTAIFPIVFTADAVEAPVTLRITESLGLAPVVATVKAAVLVE